MLASPQNYLYLGISSPLLVGLFVITLLKLKKNSNQRSLFVKLFLIAILIVVIHNWVISWCVAKNYQSLGWVLAGLPLMGFVCIAYYYAKHEKCMTTIHSVFSDCLPDTVNKLGLNLTRRL